MSEVQLSRLVVVFETELAATARLQRCGYAPDIAREIAVYLAQATDLPDHVEDIRTAFERDGVAVDFVEIDDFVELAPKLDRHRTILWCLTDGIRFYRGSAVPALARLLGIACYGAPPSVQHFCQDKFGSLALARSAGLPVPPTLLLEGESKLAALGALSDPGGGFFVKPATLGAKIGIFADSRCRTLDQARALSRRIWERYGDRVVVQPFIAGDDVRVSFMDTGRTFADQLGIFRLNKDPAGEAAGAFMTMRDNETLSGAKDTKGSRGGFGQAFTAAFVPKMLDLRRETDTRSRTAVSAILEGAEKLARLLPLRDYFSMDFRIDPDGQPTFFEFEVCPAVTIYDFQDYLERMHGLSLGTALSRSVQLAHGRQWQRGEA